jgi:hypothetical protein
VPVEIAPVEIAPVEIAPVETGAAATVVVAPLRVVDVARAGAEGFEEDAVIVFSALTRSCRLITSSSTYSKSLSAKEAR